MKVSAKLGISEQVEVSPGVWEEVVTEHDVMGTVKQRTETVVLGEDILPRYRTQTTVSVYARGLGLMDNSNLRYLKVSGKRWVIPSDATKGPKIELYLGEEYHGPVPS